MKHSSLKHVNEEGIVSSKIYRTTSWYDARVEIRPSLIQGHFAPFINERIRQSNQR